MSDSAHKIAIVEDDRDLQFIYKMKFEAVGYNVMTAADGEKGLEMVGSFRPDIILLDLRMPKMSGDEMLTRLRASDWGRDMRVIILTNISKSEAPPVLRFLHVDRYIVKAHHTPAQVVSIVRDVLGEEVY
ncbi:MAG: response regulator [Candidatus Saccharimonadales bacterium]|jgi:DNA-binding response OmpR family regulator